MGSAFAKFHLIRFLIVAGLTLAIALGSAALGRYIDQILHTSPLFLIIILISAFVALQIGLHKVMRAMTKQYNQQHFKQ